MKESTSNTKFDAALRLKLREMEWGKEEALLKCFIQLDKPIDQSKKQRLEAAGLRVLTSVKEIAAVEGKPDAIRRAANYDFVRSISLSQARPPLQRQ